MSTTTCPDWCTAGGEEYPCDGSHMRHNFESGIAASTYRPHVDERGAIFPAVSTGLRSSPREGQGTFITLNIVGEGLEDELSFPLSDAFDLAVQILDLYGAAVQEIHRPSRPDSHEIIHKILDIIDHNLLWAEHDEEWQAEVAERRARREAHGAGAQPESAVTD